MTEEPTLYEQVVSRIGEARARIDAADTSPEVHAAVHRRLDRLARYAQHDLTLTSRHVEGVHADLDAGDMPLYDE